MTTTTPTTHGSSNSNAWLHGMSSHQQQVMCKLLSKSVTIVAAVSLAKHRRGEKRQVRNVGANVEFTFTVMVFVLVVMVVVVF